MSTTTPEPTTTGGVLRKWIPERFVAIPNATVRDKGLSFKAVGVLAYILAMPDGSTVSADVLAEAHTDGRTAVLSALRELSEAGYYRSERYQDDLGRWRTAVTVSDRPMPDEGLQPESGFPMSVDPKSENPTLRAEDLRPENQKTPPSAPRGGATDRLGFPTAAAIRTGTPYPAAFEAFWKAYPRRLNKAGAYKAWLARLRDAKIAGIPIDRRTAKIIAAAENYAAAMVGKDLEFVKYAATFLGPSEPWKDYARSAAPERAARRAAYVPPAVGL